MAMKACIECTKEISTDVAVCPNCGKKNPHGKTSGVAWLGLIVVALVAYSMIKTATSSPKAQVLVPGETVSPAAPVETETAIAVDNKALWRTYEANEVAADNLYKHKLLIVSGTVSSIDKGLFDEIVVRLASPNQFMNTRAHMEKSEAGAAAGLRKGQQIRVQCRGGGRVVGSPTLRDCTIQ